MLGEKLLRAANKLPAKTGVRFKPVRGMDAETSLQGSIYGEF